MPPTCRRHVADCPIQVRTKSSSDDDDYEMLVSFVFISIMLPTLTQAAIASMQRTTPTPAATLTIIDAGKRPPRDWRTHTLPVIGLQPPPSSSSPAVRQHCLARRGPHKPAPVARVPNNYGGVNNRAETTKTWKRRCQSDRNLIVMGRLILIVFLALMMIIQRSNPLPMVYLCCGICTWFYLCLISDGTI